MILTQNEGLHRNLTLISAAAGFGKTTLLSEWVRQSDTAVAWVSLNDPSTNVWQTQSSRSGRNLVLVLNDYHLITAQPIHASLTFLLDHLPGNMHLVIATRSDPPFSVQLVDLETE